MKYKKTIKNSFNRHISRFKEINRKLRLIGKKYPNIKYINDYKKLDLKKYLKLMKEKDSIFDSLQKISYFELIKKELRKEKDKILSGYILTIYVYILIKYEKKYKNIDNNFFLQLLKEKLSDENFVYDILQDINFYFYRYFNVLKPFLKKVETKYKDDIQILLFLKEIELNYKNKKSQTEYEFNSMYSDLIDYLNNKKHYSKEILLITENNLYNFFSKTVYKRLVQFALSYEKNKNVREALLRFSKSISILKNV